MKFTKTHNDWNGEFLETITMEMREDAHIDDVLETFSRFLKAVGYHFNGQLQIIDQEDFDPLDDGQDFGSDEDSMTPEFEGPIEGFNDDGSSHNYVDEYINITDNKQPNHPWPFPSQSKP